VAHRQPGTRVRGAEVHPGRTARMPDGLGPVARAAGSDRDRPAAGFLDPALPGGADQPDLMDTLLPAAAAPDRPARGGHAGHSRRKGLVRPLLARSGVDLAARDRSDAGRRRAPLADGEPAGLPLLLRRRPDARGSPVRTAQRANEVGRRIARPTRRKPFSDRRERRWTFRPCL
jgi:hypothetical protein